MAQMVKNPPAMQETWIRSLGWGDPLERGLATLSNILACRIQRVEKPGRPQSMGSQSRTRLSDYHFHFSPPKIVNQGESIMERFIHLVSF